MNLIPGKFTLKGFDKINRKIPFASRYKEMDSTKNEEKQAVVKAKQKDDKNESKEGQTYRASGF